MTEQQDPPVSASLARSLSPTLPVGSASGQMTMVV
jgi:hypothetical protein